MIRKHSQRPFGEFKGQKADGTQVSRIKERVEEKEGIPPAQQRLIYGGKQMYVFNFTAVALLFAYAQSSGRV
jgi:hypothetical protein